MVFFRNWRNKKKVEENKTSNSKKKEQSSESNGKKKDEQKNGQSKEKEVLIKQSFDFETKYFKNEKTGVTFQLTYISTMVDERVVHENALPNLLNGNLEKVENVPSLLPIADVEVTKDLTDFEEKLLNGYVLLQIPGQELNCFFGAPHHFHRTITIPEVEFSVIGPKETFVESADQNINLIRKRLPIKELIVEEQEVGTLSKTKINIVYIDGITNEEDVKTVRQRISDIQIDTIIDSSYISQIISDNQYSLFPQILDTERPDRIAASLAEGKVAIVVDGSPHVLIAPTTLVEFFSSFEDYFLNWLISSFFRVLRLFSVSFSIFVTPFYVAVLTYHYELIPQDLIGLLITTRRQIPFPPFLEALFLEVTIELLREAGARLPTKVGQTIGIVGGIVLGTASVEAGLTSNVLLIFVALSALASFTTPVYRISNTIRLVRFPFLFLAQFWGILGIAFGLILLMAHLVKLTSLGRPMLEPVYPFRIHDFKDSFIRLSFDNQTKRPFFLRSQQKIRYDVNTNKGKKNFKGKDIDE